MEFFYACNFSAVVWVQLARVFSHQQPNCCYGNVAWNQLRIIFDIHSIVSVAENFLSPQSVRRIKNRIRDACGVRAVSTARLSCIIL